MNVKKRIQCFSIKEKKKKSLQFEVQRKLVCNGSRRRAVSIDGNIFEVNNFLSLSLVSPHNFEINDPTRATHLDLYLGV